MLVKGPGRFAQSDCAPNAKFTRESGKLLLKAIRRIEPGEEITVNYGLAYFDEEEDKNGTVEVKGLKQSQFTECGSCNTCYSAANAKTRGQSEQVLRKRERDNIERIMSSKRQKKE